jgi:hypothetical protein
LCGGRISSFRALVLRFKSSAPIEVPDHLFRPNPFKRLPVFVEYRRAADCDQVETGANRCEFAVCKNVLGPKLPALSYWATGERTMRTFCKVVLGIVTFLFCLYLTTVAVSIIFALDSAPLTF